MSERESLFSFRFGTRRWRACDTSSMWSALHKIAYSRGGQYELISTLRDIARAEIERVSPDATPAKGDARG